MLLSDAEHHSEPQMQRTMHVHPTLQSQPSILFLELSLILNHQSHTPHRPEKSMLMSACTLPV